MTTYYEISSTEQTALDGGQAVKVQTVAKGEYVKLSRDTSSVWIRGDYDRASKSYELRHTDDINRTRFVKRGKLVYVGFTY